MADAQVLSQEYSDQFLPNTVIQMIEAIFGILGNSIVLLMYTKYVQDKTVTRYFIPILAVVDLVGCLSNIIYYHLDNTMRYIFPSVYLCKTLLFFVIMTGGFSAHTILAIALQRYLIICRPFGQQMSRKLCRICIVLIFLSTIGYAAPMLKFGGFKNVMIDRNSGNATRNTSVFICVLYDGTNGPEVMVPYFGTLLLLTLINIVITSVLYISVTKIIYKRLSPSNRNEVSKNLEGSTSITSKETQQSSVKKFTIMEYPSNDVKQTSSKPAAKNNRYREQKARRNISMMFLVIIIVYVVSYLTSLVTQIHNFVTDIYSNGYVRNLYIFFLRFNLINHIANPYIYWLFDMKFRDELRKFCCNGVLRRN
jgi:hypothetical protein